MKTLKGITRVEFDMDGTIYDLYGQENWLKALETKDSSIFLTGKVMVHVGALNEMIDRLEAIGIECCVNTWLPMYSTNSFDKECAENKKVWLENHFPKLAQKLRTVSYGTPKHMVRPNADKAIIFDDNVDVREAWFHNGGIAFDEKNIIEVMVAIESENK